MACTTAPGFRRIHPGQVVAVTFLDHCEGGGTPLQFTVYGRLLTMNETALTVASWIYADLAVHADPNDPNIQSFTILRSTVQALRVLK
jgi:hypothetical protein